MAVTAQELLDLCNPAQLADALKAVLVGEIIPGLVPSVLTYSGLTSSATQVMPVAGGITAVTLADDTPLAIVLNGASGAGEVNVSYDADGVATLVFNAAVTGFKVAMSHTLPTGLVSVLLATEF
jgi:hypothetical protein